MISPKQKFLKQRITSRMLEKFISYEELGYKTPFDYWMDVLNDKIYELSEISTVERHKLKSKAAEGLAKQVYTMQLEEQLAEERSRSAEEIAELKAGLAAFLKDNQATTALEDPEEVIEIK